MVSHFILILGAISLTRFLTPLLGHNAIRSSTVTTLLLCGLLTLLVPPNYTPLSFEAAIYCASFAGMSAAARIPRNLLLPLACILTLLFQITFKLPLAIGGTLGFMAFISSFICHLLNLSMKKLIKSNT